MREPQEKYSDLVGYALPGLAFMWVVLIIAIVVADSPGGG